MKSAWSKSSAGETDVCLLSSPYCLCLSGTSHGEELTKCCSAVSRTPTLLLASGSAQRLWQQSWALCSQWCCTLRCPQFQSQLGLYPSNTLVWRQLDSLEKFPKKWYNGKTSEGHNMLLRLIFTYLYLLFSCLRRRQYCCFTRGQ